MEAEAGDPITDRTKRQGGRALQKIGYSMAPLTRHDTSNFIEFPSI